MRVSTAHTYDKAIESLQKRQTELADSQSQLTSGKKVNVPSDDPIAAARAERSLATIARSDANQRALEASRNVMQIAESSMADAVDLIQSARESIVSADTAPFIDAPGGVQFIGQGGETLAAAGEQMNLTVDGQNVWLKASSGNGVFVSDASATNTGTGWINS